MPFLFLLGLRAAMAAAPLEVTGHVRAEPVLPAQLADYELTTLEVTKEIVFHVGDQTAIGRIPILVYVPSKRSNRLEALDRLVEARALLIKAAAAPNVSTTELAALRDLLERAINSLHEENPAAAGPIPNAHG